MSLYQCIPGSGKTWLARHRPHSFYDSDVLLESFTGLKASKSTLDGVLADRKTRTEFAAVLKRLSSGSRTVLCNFDPDVFGLEADRRYAYRSDVYVTHLERAGRRDLLETFSTEDLKAWAASYEKKRDTHFMRPGRFIGDILG